MSQQRILVVEDDSAIRQGLVDALQFQGYQTYDIGRGDQGLEMARSVDCDLIVLDLVLPGGDGLDILREVRALRPTLPVIILTALGKESQRIQGLRLGADDYVVKPFSVAELLARIETVLRRSPERPSDVREVVFPGGRIDLDRCEVRLDDGRRVELPERERDLLRYLVQNAGRAISRDEILSRVWRIDPGGVPTRTIDVHIGRLREKLGDDSSSPSLILTVHGKGYMFAKTKP
ncbi:MAG: response regulator transcription factor [Planctomycetota bacterium]|nr:response regulator transcription factor [Planctomycetota bacterium]MCZ6699756.1 response regulator transcription factor [Planctomycetota bacterium]MCZ6815924.1 response regulator transcription factor [Planctomycetota bacterium]